jgi:hypothetical protein
MERIVSRRSKWIATTSNFKITKASEGIDPADWIRATLCHVWNRIGLIRIIAGPGWRSGVSIQDGETVSSVNRIRNNMGFGKGVLLWLLRIPIPIIILLALFWHH